MRIRNNIPALRASNQIGKNESLLSKAHSKLSSGLRINQAADDAAGLAISEKMRAQIRGLETAQRNVQDAVNLVQTAETALGQISNESLLRLRELAVRAANDTMTEADRKHIQDEVEQIKRGIDNIANSTIFNEVELLNQPISKASTTQRVIEMGSYAQVIAPNSMPVGFTIKSGVNDQLSFHINDTIKEITITSGIYNDLPSFIEELNRQMKNEDIPLSASLENNTRKLMFTSPIGEYEIKDISGSAEGYLLPLSTANRTSGISMNGLPVLSPEVTITEGINDTLTFDIDSVTYSITIAAGTYTVYNASASHLNESSPLLEEINQKLIAANAPVSARFIYYVNGDTPFNNGAGLYFTALENNDESAFLENGSHSFGNFGGNAKTTLFDKVMDSSGWGYQDAAGYTRSGTVVTYPSTVRGEADLSDGVTIVAGQNDILSFDINGVNNSITISQGSYDSNSLIDELNHQFTSNSIEMQASLNAFNKLVLSKTNPFDDDIIRNITGTAKGDLFFESIKGKSPVTETVNHPAKGILSIQNGANSKDSFDIYLSDVRTSALGIENLSVLTGEYAGQAIELIDKAMDKVLGEQSKMGSYQNRLEHSYNNLLSSSENLVAAESRIRDADLAKEVVKKVKFSMLSEATQAMLAQFNQNSSGILQLIK